MREVVIVSGARTAIGAFGSGLKTVSSVELGGIVINETLKRAGIRPVNSREITRYVPEGLKGMGVVEPEKASEVWDDSKIPVTIDEVIMGNVLQAAQGQNPARQSMLKGGIPKETPAMTINKVCGSGLKAIALGATAIMTGQAEVVVAGGQESMSTAPMALPKARWGHRMELTGVGEVYDLMVFDGLYEIFYGYHMGVTAENIAALYGISREDQDALSLLSHQRSRKAIDLGLFDEEIIPVTVRSRKGETIFKTDERPMDTSPEQLAQLRPAFKKNGTVTAGNASGINDGAAAVLLMSRDYARSLGIEPIVCIKGFAASGVDPAYMGLGPVPAIKRVLDNTGMVLGDIDMLELNEAFAAQALGCMRELEIPMDLPNEVGSGISLGHPIGCTGARQIVTGMYTMQREGYDTGLISLCIGGGMGMAMILGK